MRDFKSKDVDGLYPQQRKCHNALDAWWKTDSKFFVLRGYAGTGKTHVISKFLQNLGKKVNYCVTAPTHKALHVVERQLGAKGRTLHALHGLRLNVDVLNFNIQNPQFDPLGVKHIQNYALVIIDEASMINSSMFELTALAAETYNTRIIYLGDPLQLPPINELVGRAFTHVADGFTLTDVIRQGESNDLLGLFEILRDDILNGTSNCVIELIKSRGKKVSDNYKVVNTPTFRTALAEYYTSSHFVDNIDYIRTAAFTKKSVTKWNGFTRAHVIGPDAPILTINDLLTAYTNQVDDFKKPIISNSDDYFLNDIDAYIDSVGLHTYAVNMQDYVDGFKTPKLLILNHSDEETFRRVTETLNHLHYVAYIRKAPNGFRNYFNFKNNLLTMVDIQLNEMNDKKKVGKDFDYAYALTIHKLQGSTVQNIAVDLNDIVYPTTNVNFPSVPDTRNRLLYVALSRATNNAIIHY